MCESAIVQQTFHLTSWRDAVATHNWLSFHLFCLAVKGDSARMY